MKTTLTLTAWLLAAFAAAAPSATSDPAASANNRFGIELFKAVETRTAKGNKFLCPVSADLALAMVCNGATGETRAELERLLGVEGQPLEVINASKARLPAMLARAGGTDFQLLLANSLWARQGFDLRESFVQRVVSAYEARVSVLDFADSSAPATINQWVSDKTAGRIPSIVDRLADDARLLLLNATHFKADWTLPFDAGATTWRAFHPESGGQATQVPMMSQTAAFRHATHRNAQVIELPYGRNGAASMIVVLPPPEVGLAGFEKSLTVEGWADLAGAVSKSEPSQGLLVLPKLELNYAASLKPALARLGAARAFTDDAQLGELSSKSIALSEVLQKTFLAVNEKGTKAAAVTVVTTMTNSLARLRPARLSFTMVMDRPYFFAVVEKTTGSVLFLGSVRQPEAGRLPE